MNVIDALWVAVSGALVFFMQPGFQMVESGLTREKNSINVAIKNLTDIGIYALNATPSKSFNYGLVITDDINSGRYTVICKCSQSDFNEMASYYFGSSDKTEFTFVDVEGHTDYSYDKVNHILTVKDYQN